MNIEKNIKMNREKEDSKEIVIGGNKILNIFFYGVAVVFLGYVAGRAAAGNPIDFITVFKQFLSIV